MIYSRLRLALACRALPVLLALWASLAVAQDTGEEFDPYPLLPADTSSPRATLQTFLTNITEFIRAFRAREMEPAKVRAYRRALDTLDASTTPDRDTYAVLTERALLLKELLDRFELPPVDRIPGEEAVVNEGITDWTIPNTNITIRRVEEGPRAGSFLFSANTVEQLDRLYRMAKHLPYKPGATAGIYKEWLNADTVANFETPARERLMPVDTTSPRSTLFGFLESVSRAHELILNADAALKSDAPTMTIEEAREAERHAANLLERAVRTLDLSQVPLALRQDIGLESALQLKEIFDRMTLPSIEAIPDAQMVAAARYGVSGIFLRVKPLIWRYPSTEIEIVEITEGERQGEFLFSAETVDKLHGLYESINNLPYRRSDFGAEVLGYAHFDATEGFFDYYITSPGFLVAPAHFLGRFIEDLPPFLKTLYLEQAVWQWIGLLLGVLFILVAAILLFRLLGRMAKRQRPPWDAWLVVLPPVLVALVSFPVANFIDQDLSVTGEILTYVISGNALIILTMTAWASYLVCKAIAETAIASPRILDEGINAIMVRIAATVIGILIAVWIFIAGIQDLGINMIPLIAGLGVGGLAVALAAQRTFANAIGSVILFVNKPVKVGDFCRYGDQIGTVESIGLLSTHIRSLERTIVTVPNAEFSEMKLDNFSVRDERLLKTVLQLRYETTPEQMRFILIKLRELLLGHPMVTEAPARVRFVGFGAFSKDLEIFAYVRCQDQDTFLAIQEDILLRIEDIIIKAGSGFAFPSQTAYLSRDSGLDTKRRDEAEIEVRHMRVRGKLPFPDFEQEDREALEDILDYPPKGSFRYQSPVDRPETPTRGPSKLPDEIPSGEPEGAGKRSEASSA